jgi:hypothetical protein
MLSAQIQSSADWFGPPEKFKMDAQFGKINEYVALFFDKKGAKRSAKNA